MIKSYAFLYLCFFLLIYKIIAIHFSNFDLFGDEAQYWLWSQSIDFGYYSKPPLLAWFIALFCSFFGSSFFALKMFSVFIYCPIVLVIYFITKKLYGNNDIAVVTAISFFLAPAVSLSSFLLSTDILLILFWSLSLMMVLVIKDSPKLINFVLLGIFLGLGFMSKYAAIYFVISMGILFLEKSMRLILINNKANLALCLLVFLIIIAPNLLWNYQNGWLTFAHTSDNASLNDISPNIYNGLEFVFSQALMIGPVLFVGYLFIFSKYFKFDFNTKFLLIFSLPVFFIILTESILVRANANWAAVGLISFIILFVNAMYQTNPKILLINNLFNFVLGLFLFGLIATSSSYEAFKRINGISYFAEEIYLELKKDKNLVVSDRMLFSNLGYIYRNKEVNLYMTISPNTKITNHFQITDPLMPNHNTNFIFIGHRNQLNYLIKDFKAELIDEKSVFFKKDKIKIYEVVF